MNYMLAATVAPRRFNTLVMEGFAGAGLLLAMVGLYALLSYVVEQTRHEMAIRMALGASPRNVLRMVMLEGMKLSLVGSAIGLVATLVLSHAIREMLYQTQIVDTPVYCLTAVLLFIVTAAASYVPAAKAARSDPMKTLRSV